jgi:hypothetical protein
VLDLNPVRRCVYTALIGGYEHLNEQPVAARSDVEFICLTDDPDLRSDTWRIELRPLALPMDPIRSQRDLKLRPHLHLPGYDASLYIDNSVLLREPPELVFDRYLPQGPLTLFEVTDRESVLDEFLMVSHLGYDDQGRIFEQLNHYAISDPVVLQEKPFCGGIIIRHHRDEAVARAMEVWLAHVNRYSRRDQLSLRTALKLAGVQPNVICEPITGSWFHTWPHTPGRDREKGMRLPEVSLAPLVAHARRLEVALRSAQDELEQRRCEVAALQAALGTEVEARDALTSPAAPLPEGQVDGVTGDPAGVIDTPSDGAVVTGRVELAGWAVDRAAPWSTGIERIDVYLDNVLQGIARYGNRRSDVGAALGSTHFDRSGWVFPLDLSGWRSGPHTIEIRAKSLITGAHTSYHRMFLVEDLA